jgi:hypothetical protein
MGKLRLRMLLTRAKHRFKHFLQAHGLYRSTEPPPVSRVAILDFPVVPDRADLALLDIRMLGAPPPSRIPLYVNGEFTSVACHSTRGGRGFYSLPPTLLEVGENILATPRNARFRIEGIIPGWVAEERIRGASRLGVKVVVDHAGAQRVSPAEVPVDPRMSAGVSTEATSRPWVQNSLAFLRTAAQLPSERFSGLAPGCIDLDGQCPRLWSWIWTNGAVISAFLETQPDGTPYDLSQAEAVGERLLGFQVHQGVNDGAFPVRWDVTTGSDRGLTEWLAPNDAAFLASYGLVRLFEATGREEFRESALRTARWILREGLGRDGHLALGFRTDSGRWTRDWLYVDAGFTTCIFRDAWRLTGDHVWRDATHRFLDWYLDRFLQPDEGYFAVAVVDGCSRPIKRRFSRGNGWALDGLLSGWEATGHGEYLERAVALAHTMARAQLGTGAWSYDFGRRWSGPCNKGTPVIGYHLLRTHLHCGDDTILESALRARDWCRAAQVGDQCFPPAVGGIAARNEEGAITGELGVRTAFPYGSAYHIMLENLAERVSHRRVPNGRP